MYLLLLVLAYVLGSIPNSLIIGKRFFNTDIREHGSGNLGGTNAIRVLGNIGYLVILLDSLKCFVAVYLGSRYSAECGAYCGLMCSLGHCFPVLAHFKGGKSVACAYGFYLSSAIFISHDYLRFFVPIAVLLLIIAATRYVSLGSIVSTFTAAIISLFQTYFSVSMVSFLISFLVMYRHRDNIKRLISRTENKFNFKK